MASISVPRKDPKALTSYLRSVPPNQLAQALSFLEETKVPLNTIHCNVILAAHARSKNWSAALQLLNRLPQMKIQADVVPFNSAISARAMWFAALHLLKRMQSSKIIPDIFTFNSLISVCGSAAQWQQALASFEMMTAQRCLPDAITSSALVNAGASALLWEQATSLAFRIEASTASHNAVAKSLASSSWPRAAQLMCRMRQQQLDPNEITSGAAATATGSGGSWHQVLLISPRNEVWFGGLIAGSQPWPLAAHFLGMMELEQLQINEICYSACLGACAKGGAWNFAMKMFGAMPANALQQDEIAYSNVLSQSWESALGTLAMLQLGGAEANLICCSATTASCSKSQFWQQSAGLFSWIQDKKVLPNIISCNSVLSGCSWEAAQQLLDTLPLMHLESDFASYTALLTSLRSSQWELAVRAISDMSGLEVEVGPTMCNAAITACSKGAQWDMALHLLNAMPVRRIAPTAVSHCSVIDGCEAAGELDIAKEVLQSMIANGFDVTSLMWALGRLAMKDVSLIGACLSRASRLLLSDCSPKEVSILAWSCCILGVRSNLQCRLGREALERAAHLLKMTLERDGASNGTLQLVEDVLGIVWSSAFSRCLNPYCLAKIHGLLRDLGRLLDGVVHVGDRPARTLVKSAEVPKILMDLSDRLVVFKPPGWEVHNQNVPLQLSDFLQAEVPLGPVADDVQHHHGFLHRLDVPSSGLILVAKTYSAYYDLQVQLNSGDIQRDYLALCHGWMPSLEEIAAAVQVIEDGLTTCGAGRPALSRVKVLSQLQMVSARAASLVALRLGSGRRHQLRSHCAHVGHPTVTDGKYATWSTLQEDVKICPRNFLHRYRLAFNDSTGERQDLIVPLPEDLAAVLLQVMGKDHVSAGNRDSCMDGLRDWSLFSPLAPMWQKEGEKG